MNWLFPLYLAGAAAIIAPILLHLRRRPPQDRQRKKASKRISQTV